MHQRHMKPYVIGTAVVVVLALSIWAYGFLRTSTSIATQPQRTQQSSSACQNAGITVGPDQDLFMQQVIDREPSGAVVHLKPGTYRTNVLITKSLTLCGEGPQQTILEGFQPRRPVLRIRNPEVIEVTVEGLAITKAKTNPFNLDGGAVDIPGSTPDHPYPNHAQVALKNVTISASEGDGMTIRVAKVDDTYSTKDVRLTLQDVEISNNRYFGLASGNANVELRNVLFSNNGIAEQSDMCAAIAIGEKSNNFVLQDSKIIGNHCDGLFISGEGNRAEGDNALIQNVQILNNPGKGIWVTGNVTATITDVSVDRSSVGILLGIGLGTPHLSLLRAKISHSSINGIQVDTLGVAKLQEVSIEDSGIDPTCQQLPVKSLDILQGCVGLGVTREAQVTLVDSKIRGSARWGIAAELGKCGYFRDEFIGKLTFEGRNVLESNNKSGNQKGNPGDHPFKNSPDGQVCLP
ncbi:right-handed parallel beta-helix repeat-containing protein [Candidatus Acetothermia bacterium]|nr:right-handed parallel beta-helix repeat-containing protein [Candidatus Acetothermia bacterium]